MKFGTIVQFNKAFSQGCVIIEPGDQLVVAHYCHKYWVDLNTFGDSPGIYDLIRIPFHQIKDTLEVVGSYQPVKAIDDFVLDENRVVPEKIKGSISQALNVLINYGVLSLEDETKSGELGYLNGYPSFGRMRPNTVYRVFSMEISQSVPFPQEDFDDFHIGIPLKKQSSAQVNGLWQRVYIEPDPISKERYNIGVILHGPSGVQGRFLSEQSHLKCVMDEKSIDNTLFAIKHIEQSIKDNGYVPKLDKVGLSAKLPASGQSEAKILNELFDQAVPLNRPTLNGKQATSDSLNLEAGQRKQIESLSMLVKKLVHSMRKAPQHNEKLANKAIEYLQRNELTGTPLR